MKEDIIKRNTDCVFFLASPLTCKKGIECEFRHNDVARLNPRDCWYWLAGSCLNPNCGFRHPPLDTQDEATYDSSLPSYQSVVPPNCSKGPCYFYYKGFCSKGGSCSFSHGTNSSTPVAGSSIKKESASDVPPSENGTSTMGVVRSAPKEAHLSSSGTTLKKAAGHIHLDKEDHQESASCSVQKEFSQISLTEHEKTSVVGSDSLIQCSPRDCTDQLPWEHLDKHILLGEQLESSPSTDTFMRGEAEILDCEGDHECILRPNSRHGEHYNDIPDYEFENVAEYDPVSPNVDVLHRCKGYNSDYDLEHEHSLSINGDLPDQFGARVLDDLSHEQELLPMELAVNHCHGISLKSRLGRHCVDSSSHSHLYRRHNSFGSFGGRQERFGKKGLGRRLCRSVAPMVGKNRKHGFHGHSYVELSRTHFKGKRPARRQFFEIKSSKKPVRGGRSTLNSMSFSGPKTLAQIKEEQRNCYGDSRSNSTADFEGPKPLSELLKDKQKVTEL